MTKLISLDNGRTYGTAEEVMHEINRRKLWDAVVNFMDDDTREAIHFTCLPYSKFEFLKRYLEVAPDNLIIG